jgi:hypothetical protein
MGLVQWSTKFLIASVYNVFGWALSRLIPIISMALVLDAVSSVPIVRLSRIHLIHHMVQSRIANL